MIVSCHSDRKELVSRDHFGIDGNNRILRLEASAMKVVEGRVRVQLCSPSLQDNSLFSEGLGQVGRIGVTVFDGHQTVRGKGD